MKRARIIPVAEQLRRTAALDAIRQRRPLSAAEQAEADNLAERAYHREWRAAQRDAERRLAGAGTGLGGAVHAGAGR